MEYEQIKKVIECCHLNFLIGSGASKPFLGTLGSIEQLLTDLALDETCSKDENVIIEASIKKHYFEVAIKGNLDFSKSDAKLKTTKENFDTFYSAINTILLKRQTNLISRQANVFTTNMDLFNEDALEKNNYIYNDGFSGRMKPIFGTENFNNSIRKTSAHFEYQSELPLFNLLKLHGSVNWKLSSDEKIEYDNHLQLLSDIRKIKIDPVKLVDIEYEVDDPKGKYWKSFSIAELKHQIVKKKIVKDKEHEDFLALYDQLVMINPTKDKFETTTRKLTFYELLRMYSNALEKENSVLFAFGFSFADEHIREITLRVARANPTLLLIIFAHSSRTKAEMQKILPVRNNIVIVADDSDAIHYSLDTINTHFFQKLANELTHG